MMDSLSQAECDVLAERRRQIDVEGWTPKHDDEHGDGDLSRAAACYAASEAMEHKDFTVSVLREIHSITGASIIEKVRIRLPILWPWSARWWKPKDRRRDLVRAGALIIAEIERLDRQSVQKVTP